MVHRLLKHRCWWAWGEGVHRTYRLSLFSSLRLPAAKPRTSWNRAVRGSLRRRGPCSQTDPQHGPPGSFVSRYVFFSTLPGSLFGSVDFLGSRQNSRRSRHFAGDLRAFLFCGEIVKHTNSIRAHLFIPLRAFIFFRVQSYLWSEYFGIDSRAEIVLS